MFVLDRQFNSEAFRYWIMRVVVISMGAGILGLIAMNKKTWQIALYGAVAGIGVGYAYARLVS
jgi:predicted alpha/beta hydrolase